VSWNTGSPSDLNGARIQGVVNVTYYGTNTNWGQVATKVLQSIGPGFNWSTSPAVCAAAINTETGLPFTGTVCTEVSSSILLNLFNITSTPNEQYYFLVEIDAFDCSNPPNYAISKRRIGDDYNQCSATVDYNGDGNPDACRDCVCSPGTYDLGCPNDGFDPSHISGRQPCGMIIVYT